MARRKDSLFWSLRKRVVQEALAQGFNVREFQNPWWLRFWKTADGIIREVSVSISEPSLNGPPGEVSISATEKHPGDISGSDDPTNLDFQPIVDIVRRVFGLNLIPIWIPKRDAPYDANVRHFSWEMTAETGGAKP